MDGGTLEEKIRIFREATHQVWQNAAVLGTYNKAMRRIKESGPVRLEIENQQVYYDYDETFGALMIVSNGSVKFRAPCCPYSGCTTPSISGSMCNDLKLEVLATIYTKTPSESLPYVEGYKVGLFGLITSGEIEFILNALSEEYGLSWESDDERLDLCYMVGKKPYVNNELGVAIYQPLNHSKSLLIIPTGDENRVLFYTCSVAKCPFPGVFIRHLDYYCLKDYPEIKSNLGSRPYEDLMISLKKFTKKTLGKDVVSWEEQMQLLYEHGKTGLSFRFGDICGVLALLPNFMLKGRIYNKTSNSKGKSWRCIAAHCSREAQNTKTPSEEARVTLPENPEWYLCAKKHLKSFQGNEKEELKSFAWMEKVKASNSYGIKNKCTMFVRPYSKDFQ